MGKGSEMPEQPRDSKEPNQKKGPLAPYETPVEEIPKRLKEAASRSGKPLEVVCAQSFLHAPFIMPHQDEKREEWKVQLSSYYEDKGTARELDVFARRQRFVPFGQGSESGFNCVLDVFMSCKGFPPEDFPVTFSVPQVVEVKPENPPVVLANISRRDTAARELAGKVARWLIVAISGGKSAEASFVRRIIGFDIIKDPRILGKPWKANDDSTLFGGLDSAVRAALYWRDVSIPPLYRMDEEQLRIQIPVLVLSKGWHDFPVDSGKLGDPKPADLGFTSNLYPLGLQGRPPVPLFTLVISQDRLPDLQKALVELYGRLWDMGQNAYSQSV